MHSPSSPLYVLSVTHTVYSPTLICTLCCSHCALSHPYMYSLLLTLRTLPPLYVLCYSNGVLPRPNMYSVLLTECSLSPSIMYRVLLSVFSLTLYSIAHRVYSLILVLSMLLSRRLDSQLQAKRTSEVETKHEIRRQKMFGQKFYAKNAEEFCRRKIIHQF